jgi:hypothetical protein
MIHTKRSKVILWIHAYSVELKIKSFYFAAGLREFSTFVSKMVRQEFGNSFLAMTRINELDRYVMQKIRGNMNF